MALLLSVQHVLLVQWNQQLFQQKLSFSALEVLTVQQLIVNQFFGVYLFLTVVQHILLGRALIVSILVFYHIGLNFLYLFQLPELLLSVGQEELREILAVGGE